MSNFSQALAAIDQASAQGDGQAALQMARTLFREVPTKPGVLERYRTLLEQQRQWQEVVDVLTTARNRFHLWPAYSDQVMGMALMELGDTNRAEAYLEAAVQEDPNSGWARYGLGKALRANDKPEEAVAQLRQAATLLPDFAWANGEAANILNDTLQRPLEAALEALEAHRRAPEDAAITALYEQLLPQLQWLSVDKALDAEELEAAEQLLRQQLLRCPAGDSELKPRLLRYLSLAQRQEGEQRGLVWSFSGDGEVNGSSSLDGVREELAAMELLLRDLEQATGLV